MHVGNCIGVQDKEHSQPFQPLQLILEAVPYFPVDYFPTQERKETVISKQHSSQILLCEVILHFSPAGPMLRGITEGS